jgi:CRISPR-associated endonuclease Csn1
VGNTTLKAFEKLGLAEAWAALDSGHQTSIINLLADLGSPQQLDPDDWHQRFLKAGARPGDRNRYRVFHPEVIRFVDQLRNAEGFDRLTKMGFDGGRMAYSVKALNRLIEWLLHPHWRASPGVDSRVDEEAAIRECYPDAGQPGGIPGTLSAPARTGNDTVDVALAQVRWVIADALLNLGSAPSEIIVEFGREVGLGPARRNEWEKFSAKNQRLRNSAKAEITANGGAGTNTQIRRYLLWQEQGTHCPYCGSPLGLAEVLDGSQSHIEHIIPRSLTQVGRKRSEIVIAHASCNNQKGDRTPWQAFGHDEQRWTIIEERASALKKNNKFRKAKLLLLKDFEREVLNDQSIADFADRQLHQTSWIARAACQWLTQLCSNVFAARGEFTALLRRSWHLDTVIPEIRLEHGLSVLDIDGKSVTAEEFANYRRAWEGHGRAPGRILDKRLDHRHHAIDALVIGLADRSIYQKLARNYKQSLAEGPTAGHRHEWQAEPPLANVREQAKEMIDTCRLTHKPDRFPAGALFQETAYSLKVNREDNSASLASREVLSGLLDEKSPEKTRKNLASIASVEVREFVLAEFERRIASGETPKQALSRPVQYPRYRTQIWRVRRMRSDVSAAKARPVIFSSRAGEHSKLLLPDGNAYLEVKGAGRGATVRVVSLAEAATAADVEPSMEVRRFFKGDTVIDGDDGSTLIVKQVVAPTDGQPMLRLVPIFETREWAALRARDGRRQIAGAQLIRLIHADVCTSSVAAGRLSPPRN